MNNKLICSLIFCLSVLFISASGTEYRIQDIGTLQAHSSHAISINNHGQILGWLNIDGSKESKQFFIRDKNGAFHHLPKTEKNGGWEIDWRYLTDEGKAYGTFDGNSNYSVLYTWDQNNGVINLGNLPGKEISAINNAGQVLIKSVIEIENGKSFRRPVIWHNGLVTKLRGLEGNIGIESDESYGYDMNNNGDVVGYSNVYINYKNNLYRQNHAAKWVNGQVFDLHKSIQKTNSSKASVINDFGDVIIGGDLIRADGKNVALCQHELKIKGRNNFHNKMYVLDRDGNVIINGYIISNKFLSDQDSIWMTFKEIIAVNDNGEIIARGVTIYGEEHAILLYPAQSD